MLKTHLPTDRIHKCWFFGLRTVWGQSLPVQPLHAHSSATAATCITNTLKQVLFPDPKASKGVSSNYNSTKWARVGVCHRPKGVPTISQTYPIGRRNVSLQVLPIIPSGIGAAYKQTGSDSLKARNWCITHSGSKGSTSLIDEGWKRLVGFVATTPA